MTTFLSASVSSSNFVAGKNRPIVTIATLVALATNFLFTSGHDQQRCIELALLCILAIVLIARIARGKIPNIPVSGRLLLSGFFCIGLASVSGAQSLRHAAYEWSIFLMLMMLAFAIADEIVQDEQGIYNVTHWIGVICGIYSLRIVFNYLIAVASGYQPDWSLITIGFSNHRFLNHAQTPLLPLIIFLCIKASPNSQWRKAWFILAAFWWALLFVTEARATILAVGIGGIIALISQRVQARRFMAMMAWTVLGGVIIYVLFFTLLPMLFGLHPFGAPANFVTRTMDNPTSNRNLLWARAVNLIAVHPWLGIGPHHFAHAGSDLETGAHPHNWILQIGSEWGVPALSFLLGAVILGAKEFVHTYRELVQTDTDNQQISVALLTACSAVFIDGLFSGVLVMPQSQLAIVLMLSIVFAWVRSQNEAHSSNVPPSIFVKICFAGLVAVGFCSLIWSVAPGIVHHARGDVLTPAEQDNNPATHWPRMWEAGCF